MRTRNNTGLGLFELLLALALLALIAAGLAATLGLGKTLYTRSAALSDGEDKVALRVQLRMWLAAAAPPQVLTTFPTPFVGKANQVSFVTLAPTPFAADAAAMAVTVTNQVDHLTLRADLLDDAGNVMSTIDRPLADGLEAIQFDYFDAKADPPEWRTTWQDDTRLPDLVRIATATGDDWPEFTVELLLGR